MRNHKLFVNPIWKIVLQKKIVCFCNCMKLYFDKLFVHIISRVLIFVSTAVFGSIWAGELHKRSRNFSQLILRSVSNPILMSADFSDKEKLREKVKWRFLRQYFSLQEQYRLINKFKFFLMIFWSVKKCRHKLEKSETI